MDKKRTKKAGFILCAASILLGLTLGLFLHISLKENTLKRNIQRSVLKMDKEMEQLTENGLYYEELEKTRTGLAVFINDTLMYWNRNDLNPKLMRRKVTIRHDTICSMPTGNYYIKSYQIGMMSYYMYKQLNTSYQIENQYFENQCSVLPKFIKADISFTPSKEGDNILNKEGKILTKCQIRSEAKIR